MHEEETVTAEPLPPVRSFPAFREAMQAVKEEAREMSVFTGAPAADCIAAAVRLFCVAEEYV